MTNAVIDFESYYDKDVSVVGLGNRNYFKQAEAYIVAATVGDEIYCGTIAEMGPTCEQIAKDPTVRCWAANSNFDQGWWEKYYPKTAHDWECLLDLGAFHQYPRNLAGLSQVTLGLRMDKSVRDEMRGVRYESLPDAEKARVIDYCIGDVRNSQLILEKLPAMSDFERQVAAHTRLINRRGVFINLDLVETDKTRLEEMQFNSLKAIPWHADAPPLSYQALTRYCASKGIPVPKSTAKTSEECDDLMSEHPELKEVLGLMRRFRKANTMLRKVETLMYRTDLDESILPLDILYCGAPHTRRWSSKGFNVQNLDKEPLDCGNGQKVWTRNWIVPRPGKIFLILDFAQIEPRCLNWLAGNDDMMEALRNGFSYYEAYVTAAKQAARVGWSGKAGTLKKEVGLVRYTKIKNESLGCGYGMGATKYMTYANVSPEEAKEVVDGFRKNNPKIVQFWRKLDSVISSAARDKGKHLAMELPTGDLLQHFNVRPKSGKGGGGYESFTIKGDFGQASRQPRLWGGTLTENVTQRMARDVLADAILRLEAAGLQVAFHAHDEVILEVDAGEASQKEAKAEAEQIMSTAPAWAEGLPLAVEGDFATEYTK
jgi:DNA polymerase